MKKRIAAIITCVVMAAAYMPVFAYGATTDSVKAPMHYVSLGDENAAGAGMTTTVGMNVSIDRIAQEKYGIVAEGSYPALISSALSGRGFDVTLDQMAVSGMRIEELRYLLDDSYSGDAYLKENFKDLSKYRADYRERIKDADLITCQLGGVDFGAFLVYIASDVEKHCSDEAVKALVKSDADGVAKDLKDTAAIEKDKIPDKWKDAASSYLEIDIDEAFDEYSGTYVDAMAYAYYSFCMNYDKAVQLIRAQNPDATLVVLGMDNMLDDMSIYIKGGALLGDSVTFNIGELYKTRVIDRANEHLNGINGVTAVADCEGFQRFLGEIRDYNKDPTTISQQFKDYCDTYEDDLLLAKDKDKQLPDKSKQERGMKAAYDTAASSMKDIAGINPLQLTITLDLKDKIERIPTMEETLMKGLKDKCWELAKKNVYIVELQRFIGTADNPGPLYGEKSGDRQIGRIVMAVAMRAEMGDGFFMQPSAAGHKQIRDSVLSACTGQYVHVLPQEMTCTEPGIIEFWQSMDNGDCYTDKAHTNKVPRTDCITPAPGHQWAKEIVDPAGVCHDGLEKDTCTVCQEVCTIVLPGSNPAGTKIKKLTGAKKALTVKWAKPSAANLKPISGYEIRYSLKSNMSGAKTVKVTNKNSTSKKITKLKAKKKYFVQIRTYGKDNSKMFYSGWSAKKSIKTK